MLIKEKTQKLSNYVTDEINLSLNQTQFIHQDTASRIFRVNEERKNENAI